jgi:hypothetical protein
MWRSKTVQRAFVNGVDAPEHGFAEQEPPHFSDLNYRLYLFHKTFRSIIEIFYSA